MNLDGNGGAAGSMRATLVGEDCGGAIVSGSNYTVNSDGTGFISLTVNFSGPDLDADIPDCSSFFGMIVPSPQKMDIVLQENGEHFAFAGMDDLVNVSSDGGDSTLAAFRGSCVSQTKS